MTDGRDRVTGQRVVQPGARRDVRLDIVGREHVLEKSAELHAGAGCRPAPYRPKHGRNVVPRDGGQELVGKRSAVVRYSRPILRTAVFPFVRQASRRGFPATAVGAWRAAVGGLAIVGRLATPLRRSAR